MGLHLFGRRDDTARRLEVEGVDCHDGIALGIGLSEHALHDSYMEWVLP